VTTATNEIRLDLKLNTSEFDRQIRRVRRQAHVARMWGFLWLAAYAAVMTGAAVTLAIVEIVR
jgi:hypothetical protein